MCARTYASAFARVYLRVRARVYTELLNDRAGPKAYIGRLTLDNAKGAFFIVCHFKTRLCDQNQQVEMYGSWRYNILYLR